MDPAQNSQVQDQNPSTGSGLNSQQPVASPSQTWQGQTAPAGSIQKEQGPVVLTSPTAEFIKPSEQAPQISKELLEMGVESVSNVPDLTKQHQEAGIDHAKESVPVAAEPTGAVQIPMTQNQAQTNLKLHKKVSDSIVWLATLILKYFKTAQT